MRKISAFCGDIMEINNMGILNRCTGIYWRVLNFKKLGQLAYIMKSNYSLLFICNSSKKEVVNEYAF